MIYMPGMQAIVERDEQNCGKDADHPLALRVRMGEPAHGGYPQGMGFLIEYRLKIEGDEAAKRVSGTCDIREMKSPPTDEGWPSEYITQSLAASVPAVKAYLEGQHPGARITGVIRSLFESAYHRQQDFVL